MAQWGRNDQAVTANSTTTVESSNGAPIGTYALVNGGSTSNIASIAAAHTSNAHFGNTSSGSRAGVDAAMFGNTTINAFRSGVAVGVFGVGANSLGVAAAESGVGGGSIAEAYVSTGGSGYQANAVVTITFANGTTNAVAINSTASATGATVGRITALTINSAGSGILGFNPAVAIAAPASISVTANTNGVVAATDFIKVTTANSYWQAGDRLYYGVATGNTAIGGLTGNAYYYVSFANTTGIVLSATAGGANIDLTEARTSTSETGHTIQGDAATGYIVVGGTKNKGVAHAGWVLRTEGTGGRAGRVQYETLVAMGSLGAQTAAYGTPALVADAGDDTFIHDA
jgi:hypothetical protein